MRTDDYLGPGCYYPDCPTVCCGAVQPTEPDNRRGVSNDPRGFPLVEPKPMAIGNLYGREDKIRALKCVTCGVDVPADFAGEDPEYIQSGMCRACQAEVFGCTCDTPCCEADVGVGVIHCGSQHCPVHGVVTGNPGGRAYRRGEVDPLVMLDEWRRCAGGS